MRTCTLKRQHVAHQHTVTDSRFWPGHQLRMAGHEEQARQYAWRRNTRVEPKPGWVPVSAAAYDRLCRQLLDIAWAQHGDISDLAVRFAAAVVTSSAWARDREKVRQWYEAVYLPGTAERKARGAKLRQESVA